MAAKAREILRLVAPEAAAFLVAVLDVELTDMEVHGTVGESLINLPAFPGLQAVHVSLRNETSTFCRLQVFAKQCEKLLSAEASFDVEGN